MGKKDHYSESDVLEDDPFIDQTTPILEDADEIIEEEERKVRRVIKRKTDILEDLHLVAGKGPQVHHSIPLYSLTEMLRSWRVCV